VVKRSTAERMERLTTYFTRIEAVRAVLDTLIPKEIEVQISGGIWYLIDSALHESYRRKKEEEK